MMDLFSAEWMTRFMAEWNNEPELAEELAHIKFNSNIAYGFLDEPEPRGVLKVIDGKVVSAGGFKGEQLNWDLRAEPEDWQDWFQHPPGIMALGMAYTSRRLTFERGDYASMIKDPRMAEPFIKSFTVMGRV